MTQAAPTSTPDPDAWARETEDKVLDAALVHVVHEGWTRRLATRAGAEVGLSAGETELLLPNGAADLAALRRRRRAVLASLASPRRAQ